MFDRRTILALVVVGLILLLLPKYYQLITPKAPPATEVVAPDSVTTPTDSPPVTTPQVTESAPPAATPTSTTPQTPLVADTAKLVNDFVDIETPLYHMTIASNGLVSGYELKEYQAKAGDPVALHVARTAGKEMVGAVDFNFGSTNPKTLKDLRFQASKARIFLSGSGADSVVLTAGDPTTQFISLTYVFQSGSYGFQVALSTGGLSIPETGEYQIKWIGGVPVTEPNPISDLQYSGAYAQIGSELEKVHVGADPEKTFQATGQTFFMATRSKYFMAAVIPQDPAAGIDIVGRNPTPKVKDSPQYYELSLREMWGPAANGRWAVYWGPIKYENLKAFGVGLDETMNWGWQIIKPFSKGVLWSLTALRTYIPNYGWVIVIFSILVKIILWPLTRKSQVSMKKMAALQPEIKELRELHKNNPQAMNAAMMKLYKDRGVNPASGCIPILFQMPILYALFIVFSTTIEFRQAPFMLWITDLSLPDIVFHLPFSIPLYGAGVAILPLVMGVTQFFMSRATATDPNQKMMIYIMPVFMTLIFNQFPSGLTLYYTLFNVLAMVEQRLIKLPDFTPSAEVVDEKKSKKK